MGITQSLNGRRLKNACLDSDIPRFTRALFETRNFSQSALDKAFKIACEKGNEMMIECLFERGVSEDPLYEGILLMAQRRHWTMVEKLIDFRSLSDLGFMGDDLIRLIVYNGALDLLTRLRIYRPSVWEGCVTCAIKYRQLPILLYGFKHLDHGSMVKYFKLICESGLIEGVVGALGILMDGRDRPRQSLWDSIWMDYSMRDLVDRQSPVLFEGGIELGVTCRVGRSLGDYHLSDLNELAERKYYKFFLWFNPEYVPQYLRETLILSACEGNQIHMVEKYLDRVSDNIGIKCLNIACQSNYRELVVICGSYLHDRGVNLESVITHLVNRDEDRADIVKFLIELVSTGNLDISLANIEDQARDLECPICLKDDITSWTRPCPTCPAMMCKSCVNEWSKHGDTCPFCRSQLRV